VQKNALIRKIKEKTGLKQKEIKRFMNAFINTVGNSLSADQKVTISGLGTFLVRERKEKSIVNPNNPFEKITLPKRKVVKYLAGKTIKDDLRSTMGTKAKTTDQPDQSQTISKKKIIVPKTEEKQSFKPIKKIHFAPLSQRKYAFGQKLSSEKEKVKSQHKKTIEELVKEISEEVEKRKTAEEKPKAMVKTPSAPQKKTQPGGFLRRFLPVRKSPEPQARADGLYQKPFSQMNQPQTAKPSVTEKSPPIQGVPPAKLFPGKPSLKQNLPSKSIIKRTTPFSDIQKKRKFVRSPLSPTEERLKAKPAATKKLPPKIPPGKKPLLTAGVKIPYINLSQKTIPKKILSKIPEYIARLYQAVPVDIDEQSKKLVVAMVDPEDYQAIEFIKKKTGYQIEPRLSTNADIGRVLDQYSGIETEVAGAIKGTELAGAVKEAAAETGVPTEKKEEVTSEAPTARVVQSILRRAVSSKASDIHIEPEEDDVIVRFRIDGVLQKVLTLPKKIQASIISRVKILSGMKIDEQRLPQDGRFEIKMHDRDIDFRVSTFPSINGEKVVMRILDKTTGILSLDELGLTGDGFKRLDEAIHKSHGMALVTGPTGSGKTTTLYAVIDRIMNVGVNIVTLEDPVEYQIKGINQGQVRTDIGFTFAKGLRSIVRQDPDIIMVGEIRDLETAEMAVHAALTGHIVLSTLHTNDAAGAIPRLIDMGVEPFLITSSLATVVGQRLARKICEECRVEEKISSEVLDEIKKGIAALPKNERVKYQGKALKFYKGQGCAACGKSGYKGRIGIFEVLPMTESIGALALKKVGAGTITKKALEEGMITMKQDGIIKAFAGKTTIEEIWRVTKE
jgi:type IV pilus assembly protein PilB